MFKKANASMGGVRSTFSLLSKLKVFSVSLLLLSFFIMRISLVIDAEIARAYIKKGIIF